MNSHHNQRNIPLNLKSLKTRFALRFLRALKKIHIQEKIHNKNKNNNGVNILNNNNTMVTTHQKFLKVKVAADASMAATVGPSRAWSRAVLSRLRVSWRSRRVAANRRKQRREAVSRPGQQTQELRRLVPGGEVMDMQSLLDETAHYIKCLTTQVKVMRSIVNYCSTPVN